MTPKKYEQFAPSANADDVRRDGSTPPWRQAMKIETEFNALELWAVCITSSAIGLLCMYGLVRLGMSFA